MMDWLKSSVELALADESVKEEFKNFLKEVVE
jgi:hypothetical protein